MARAGRGVSIGKRQPHLAAGLDGTALTPPSPLSHGDGRGGETCAGEGQALPKPPGCRGAAASQRTPPPASRRGRGGAGDLGEPSSPDSCSPPLPPPRERGLGGEGGPDAPGREVRVPLPNGDLPLSARRGRRGLGGAGVPGGPPRVARAASNPTSRLVRLGEGAVARRPEPGRSDRTDRQTQGETPRIVLRHRMIYDVPLHHRRAGGPGPAATGRDPRRRHDGTGGEAARGARVSRHRDRACRHGTTPVVNRRLAGTEGHQSMSAQHLDQPTRIAGARTRRDSPRLAAMAIAGDVAEPRAHRQACRLVRNPANTSSPA